MRILHSDSVLANLEGGKRWVRRVRGPGQVGGAGGGAEERGGLPNQAVLGAGPVLPISRVFRILIAAAGLGRMAGRPSPWVLRERKEGGKVADPPPPNRETGGVAGAHPLEHWRRGNESCVFFL